MSARPGGALSRQLGLLDSVAIIVGVVIGVGIFRVPASIAEYLSSPLLVLGVWVVGGLLALCGGLCYAELSAAFPRTGGDYVYLRESYGPCLGFLFGWTQLLVIRPGNLAGIAYIFAEYAAYFAPLPAWGLRALAVAAIALLTGLNLWGLRFGRAAQHLLTGAKVLGLLLLALAGLALAEGANLEASVQPPSQLPLPLALGTALIFAMWTYGGWNESTYVAGEMKNPARDLPRSIALALFLIVGLYLTLNAVFLAGIPPAELPKSGMVAAVVVERFLGGPGGGLVALLVTVSALGALNGTVLTSSRLTYAFGADHPRFALLAGVHPRFHTPAAALLLNGLWSALLVCSGTFDQLIGYTSAVTWLFFALIAAGLFVLRRRHPLLERPYRVWAPLPPLFIAASLWLTYCAVDYSPLGSLAGLGILLAGLPLYYLIRPAPRA
ncbi:MAG: amino acid permease [Candidatus Handelsmanbacteria bacterium]|nr:amino acid permease [Candidatus Handelsmanbacteria bacterium]